MAAMVMQQKYLHKKEFAKIIYDLYSEMINPALIARKREIEFPTEIDSERYKKYQDANQVITGAEIFSYENELIYLSDEPYMARLDVIRESTVPKRTFVNAIFTPIYKLVEGDEDVIYNEELDYFILENKLFRGIAETDVEMDKWFKKNAETILSKEAKKIVSNAFKFMALIK